MCGRFSLTLSPQILSDAFKVTVPGDLTPRYNIAPGQPILAIRQNDAQQPEAALLHWGLIPHWAKDPSIGYKMINARSETVAEKTFFRAAYRQRHCLIPADGFYEWTSSGGKKRPHLFRRTNKTPFALAGLWERWEDQQSQNITESCTILTTEANSLVAPVHHRMPVMIDQKYYEQWLNASQESGDLLASRDWSDFESLPVSTYVNSAEHEGPECHAPPESTTPLLS